MIREARRRVLQPLFAVLTQPGSSNYLVAQGRIQSLDNLAAFSSAAPSQKRMGSKSIQREWFPPEGVAQQGTAGLMLYNSLVDEKTPFVPAAGPGSKQITWYTCGPTVYDSAHMGHARNYVTFDILRRVLEDYFGYNCLFVMNVTDVDDKIILRARRNYLLKQYCESGKSVQQVSHAWAYMGQLEHAAHGQGLSVAKCLAFAHMPQHGVLRWWVLCA